MAAMQGVVCSTAKIDQKNLANRKTESRCRGNLSRVDGDLLLNVSESCHSPKTPNSLTEVGKATVLTF